MKSLYDIFEALDFKLTAVHDVVDSVSKKLTVVIKLLRQTLSPESRQTDVPKQEHKEDGHSYQSLQARVDSYVLEQALDTASRFGMPPQ